MKYLRSLCSFTLIFAIASPALAQFGGPPPPPPPEGRIGAPADLTGTWVSIITEDWQWRMSTPLIGDFSSVPENDAAKEIAMQWRPEQDVGNECRAYGAPAIMNEPSRLRISWVDDMTLQMEIDSGMQIRTFYFDETVSPEVPSRQGYTVANWDLGRSPPRASGFAIGIQRGGNGRTLVAHTNNLIPGYLRKNGIPHSAEATVTEYINVIEIADGTTWLIDTVVVEDPVYLLEPWVVSRNFKKEENDSNWNPQSCW